MHGTRNARALPIGILLAAEPGHGPIRPRVHVRAVIGPVDNDGVIGDGEIVELLEKQADMIVVLDHTVCVFGAYREAGLLAVIDTHMGSKVHSCPVEPAEKRFVSLGLAINEIHRRSGSLVVDGFHPLLVRGPVSSMVCLPTRPKRGSSVGSSRSAALHFMTPRGPKFARKAGSRG